MSILQTWCCDSEDELLKCLLLERWKVALSEDWILQIPVFFAKVSSHTTTTTTTTTTKRPTSAATLCQDLDKPRHGRFEGKALETGQYPRSREHADELVKSLFGRGL